MKTFYLFCLTNIHVAAGLETRKPFFKRNFHSLTSLFRCNPYESEVGFWEVIFLAVLLITEPQNKKGRLISSNTLFLKVGAMSTLTTLDLHSESETKNSLRYNSVVLWLGNFEVIYKYSFILIKNFLVKCRDIKGLLYI